jgi:hypothetical protein
MARKIHLRRNKNPEIKVLAACASNPYVSKARSNGRTTYQFMASEIVGWDQFKTMDSSLLCAHCLDAALVIRNRQRKDKGLPPITVWNEGVAA